MSPKPTIQDLPEDLRTLAETALSTARRELEQTGRLNPSIHLQGPNGMIAPLKMDDEEAEKYFGSDHSRVAFFQAMREIVAGSGTKAVVLCNDIWTGKTTDKFRALPDAEQEQIFEGAYNIESLVARGLMVRREAIMVQIQTQKTTTWIQQIYERDRGGRRIVWGERTFKSVPQEEVSGTMRMFGAAQ